MMTRSRIWALVRADRQELGSSLPGGYRLTSIG